MTQRNLLPRRGRLQQLSPPLISRLSGLFPMMSYRILKEVLTPPVMGPSLKGDTRPDNPVARPDFSQKSVVKEASACYIPKIRKYKSSLASAQ